MSQRREFDKERYNDNVHDCKADLRESIQIFMLLPRPINKAVVGCNKCPTDMRYVASCVVPCPY